MKVINGTSYMVMAVGWHTQRGFGQEVAIPAGETAEVDGPYLGEMGSGPCYTVVPGEITCQDTPDDEKGHQVAPGRQLHLQRGDVGISVWHFAESRL